MSRLNSSLLPCFLISRMDSLQRNSPQLWLSLTKSGRLKVARLINWTSIPEIPLTKVTTQLQTTALVYPTKALPRLPLGQQAVLQLLHLRPEPLRSHTPTRSLALLLRNLIVGLAHGTTRRQTQRNYPSKKGLPCRSKATTSPAR